MPSLTMLVRGIALFCVGIIASVPLSLCAAEKYVPKVVENKQAIDVSQLHIKSTAQVGVVRFDIEPHDFVGALTMNDSCFSPLNLSFDAYELVSKRANRYDSQWTFNVQSLQKTFAEEMEKAGYPRYDPDLSLFGETLGSDADLRIGLTFTNFKFNKCSNRNLSDTQGSAYIEAIIEVFSPQVQQVIYTSAVQASYKQDGFHRLKDRDFNQFLIRQMINNLLSDPNFVAAFHSPADTKNQTGASQSG